MLSESSFNELCDLADEKDYWVELHCTKAIRGEHGELLQVPTMSAISITYKKGGVMKGKRATGAEILLDINEAAETILGVVRPRRPK